MHELVIRDASVVTPAGRLRGDLAVDGGAIASIGEGLPPGRAEVRAGGRWLVPGAVDSPCHIAQAPVAGEPPCPHDWETATRAAVAGGTTTVIPQSMAARGADVAAALDAYLAGAPGQALADYAVQLQMLAADPAFLTGGLPRLAARGVRAVKMFSTYPGYALGDAEILAILDAAARAGVIGILHAEDDALVRHATSAELAAGRTGIGRQTFARPQAAEATLIHRAVAYGRANGARLHVFHVSGALALAEIARARAQGLPLTAETCAHFLAFTAADLDRPDFEGAKFLCAPPLRSEGDHAALWAAPADGGPDIVSSDHSPSHRMPAILRARAGASMTFADFGGGFPGLQMMAPTVLSLRVATGRLSPERFAEVTATAPARLFGLTRKGRLQVGCDADFCLWDPAAAWTVRHQDMESRVDFAPWDGMAMTGRPVLTAVRGRIVMRDGRIDSSARGHGALIAMEAPG